MSEEINIEELERELRELDSEKAIEIKPVVTAVTTQTQAEEEESGVDLEHLEKELEKAEAIAEKKYLEKHGGLCHHVKLEKFNEPVTVCRSSGVHEDEEKLLVSLLYKYYPYVLNALRVINEIKPCKPRRALHHGFDLVMFADPVRMASLLYDYNSMIAELAYIYELDVDKNRALGVHLEVVVTENRSSVKSVCRINEIHSLAHSLLKALRLPAIDLEQEES